MSLIVEPTTLTLGTLSPEHSNPRLSTLPTELLLLIFQPLRPTLTFIPKPNLYIYRDPSELGPSEIAILRNELATFARFRLVSAALSQVIKTILYKEVIIFITTSLTTQALDNLFEVGRNLIRSVMVYGPAVDLSYQARRKLPEQYGKTIGRGLGLCSNIRNLECYRMHDTFTRNWLLLAPSLLSSLTKLTFRVHGINISHALDGLDVPLETLELIDWTRLYTKLPDAQRPPHSPCEMPNLKHIILRSGIPHPDDLRMLFNRLTKNKDPATSLRSVSFLYLERLTAKDITDILSTNRLGAYLTIFHFSARQQEGGDGLVIAVLKSCPNLLDFSCGIVTGSKVLQHIPHNLQVFGIMLAANAHGDIVGIRLQDMLRYPETQQGRQLHTLYLLGSSYSEAELKSACEQFGLAFTALRRRFYDWQIIL